MSGDGEAARRHLRNSFEVLVEARERFYPVDAYLVDLTLVAPTTVGESLRRQLVADGPQNLLISGETLLRVAEAAPDTLAALPRRSTTERSRSWGVNLPSASCRSCPSKTHSLNSNGAQARFRRLSDRLRASTAGDDSDCRRSCRRCFRGWAIIGAFHATLDDGRFATASQSKVRWEGLDHSAIDALTRLPLDANRPDTFLSAAHAGRIDGSGPRGDRRLRALALTVRHVLRRFAPHGRLWRGIGEIHHTGGLLRAYDQFRRIDQVQIRWIPRPDTCVRPSRGKNHSPYRTSSKSICGTRRHAADTIHMMADVVGAGHAAPRRSRRPGVRRIPRRTRAATGCRRPPPGGTACDPRRTGKRRVID